MYVLNQNVVASDQKLLSVATGLAGTGILQVSTRLHDCTLSLWRCLSFSCWSRWGTSRSCILCQVAACSAVVGVCSRPISTWWAIDLSRVLGGLLGAIGIVLSGFACCTPWKFVLLPFLWFSRWIIALWLVWSCNSSWFSAGIGATIRLTHCGRVVVVVGSSAATCLHNDPVFFCSAAQRFCRFFHNDWMQTEGMANLVTVFLRRWARTSDSFCLIYNAICSVRGHATTKVTLLYIDHACINGLLQCNILRLAPKILAGMGIPRLTLTLICLALFVARYGYHRIGRLERNELVREECFVEKFV